jgi:hypothetical protein
MIIIIQGASMQHTQAATPSQQQQQQQQQTL